MNNHIGQISLLVRDYDEAIEYYSRVLGFKLIEDTELSKSKRWVVIGPDGDDPRIESYGKVLVLQDLYGNLWDLIHRNY